MACFRARSLPAEQADRIRDLIRVLGDLVPPELRDRALARAVHLNRPSRGGDPEATALLIQAARSIRVEDGPFSDDGPIQAHKALRRLDAVLMPDERSFLERCAAVVNAAKVIEIVREAVLARNGWKVIHARCATQKRLRSRA